MKTPDQAVGWGEVRAQEMRTFGWLRSSAPAPGAADRLTDRALHAAAANPDHSEAGRAAAAHSLRARSITVSPWRVRVESFLRQEDLERGEAFFFHGARRWFSALAALGATTAIGLIAWRATSAPDLDLRPSAAAAAIAAIALALWFIASVLRARPARLTVLGGDDIALRRMLRVELKPFGHVARMDAPDAPIVSSAAGYRALARRLRSRIALNFASAVSRRAPLLVRASEAWTPLVRRLLTDSSDAVIVDLSDSLEPLHAVTEGDVALNRCVFVTLWGRIDEAEAALRDAHIDAPCFFYAPDGEMQRRSRFRAALLSAMRASQGFPA